MLGTHGIGVFCVNGRRWPDLRAPWIGWHSIDPELDWRRRGSATMKSTIERFEIGNPSLISAYVLENGLAMLMQARVPEIERHALALGGELRSRLVAAGWPVLTPKVPEQRAGNICIASERAEALEARLRGRGVLAWGGDGRLRLSVHGFNDPNDIERAVAALRAYAR
jgi:selenocysteine lyase/cysteine desulfurase